jgi:two-component system, NarL family, sensor histidine kinase BarA
MSAPAPRSLDELTLGAGVGLEDLVERQALEELLHGFYELFELPLRVFAIDGKLIASAGKQPSLYEYLNGLSGGRRALQALVQDVKSIDPGDEGRLSHACASGGLYFVIGIHYDARVIGRMVLGPFLPPAHSEPPASLLAIDPALDPERARALLSELPRAAPESVLRMARHLAKSLDLILFSGHKALLTSSMHLASVRESYRELQDKNAKLQQAYDRLKELDRLKSNFLATVSHELRTPLTSIIGYSEMLREGIAGRINDDQREFVATIHEKGEQLLDLIKGLLDLSKLESGSMSLRKADMDLTLVIQDVTQTLAPSARKKQIALEWEAESGLPTLWADAERMRQILLNLTENAIKFTPSGGSVRISARSTVMDRALSEDGGGMVLLPNKRPALELRVADTGIGIAPSDRERVFDAFYQVDSSSTREQGGTGLGLSIVRRLVDAHDGIVEIEDNPPQGTIFVVTLPCKRATLS